MERSESDSGKDPDRIAELERELERTRQDLARARADLADRTGAELSDRRAQRLEALGQLAAGVAHEINTPMQFISDNVHFLRDGFDGALAVLERLRAIRDRAREGTVDAALIADADRAEVDADLDYLTARLARAFEVTLEGIDRVSEIVAAMKVFTNPPEDLTDVDLHRVLSTTLTVARHEYRDVADVITDLRPVPMVLGHAGDLNQAFLELIVNAARAIVAAGGRRGTITVRTRTEGRHAVIELADTGCGMTAEQRARVFGTAARRGHHGLAAVLAVVERHCGQLDVASEPGAGTTVRVRLPTAGPETLRQVKRLRLPPR